METTALRYGIEEDIFEYEIVGMIPRMNGTVEYHMEKENKNGCVCTTCGGRNTKPMRTRTRTLHALPQEDMPVLLKIKVQDYTCNDCNGKMFTCPLVEEGKGEIPPRGRYTWSLIEWIQNKHRKENLSCSKIAEIVKVSKATICEIVN